MKVEFLVVDEERVGQRIDNFLVGYFKKVPSTRVYKAIRKGEIRVNKGRVKPDYRLNQGDKIRLPPLYQPLEAPKPTVAKKLLSELELRVIYEDSQLLVVNKPSGIPVHGGTGIHLGLIEALRQMRPKQRFLELVHRLDRETSGCLLVAKKRQVLVALHRVFTNRWVKKQYFALVAGEWQGKERRVDMALKKNVLKSGERVVTVDHTGKPAVTIFKPLRRFRGATLVEALPLSGRTHQIRVHAAYLGHPIAGDLKYGDKIFNRAMSSHDLQRLFLHAAGLSLVLNNQPLAFCATLDEELTNCLNDLKSS